MKKGVYFVPLLIILVMMGLIIGIALCFSLTGSGVTDPYYWFNNYYINIVVDENKCCVITEEIEVEFDVASAGITRVIPKKNYIYRSDGSKSQIYAELRDFKMIYNGASENKIYYKETTSTDYIYELGFSNKKYQKIHNYKFSYTYDLNGDNNYNFDEFYFNIVGSGWDCRIKNVEFSVTLPKLFDINALENWGATYGKAGSNNDIAGKGELNAQIIDNQVVFEGYIHNLAAFEALTLRVKLDDGYFTQTTNIAGLWYTIAATILGAMLVIFTFTAWKKYGKDYDVVSPVTFYPPKGINIIDMEHIYQQKISTKSIVAYIVKLAKDGYIRIESGANKKEDYTLHKIKDYAGQDKHEARIMQSLFLDSNSVKSKKIGKKLAKYTDSVFNTYNSGELYAEFYEPVSMKKMGLFFTLFTVFLLVATFIALSIAIDSSIAIMLVFIIGVSSVIFMGLLSNYQTPASKKLAVVWIILFASVLAYTICSNFLLFDIWMVVFYVTSILVYAISSIITQFMSRRKKKITDIYGEIIGFKDFLESVEKEKLETLVADDPEYFYNILPYTYVLEISDKWIEKLDYLHIPQPEWIVTHTPDSFYINMCNFDNAMGRVNSSIHSGYTKVVAARMAAAAARSGGGGGGRGGGSSGGGAGGGGGGRR